MVECAIAALEPVLAADGVIERPVAASADPDAGDATINDAPGTMPSEQLVPSGETA